MCGPFLQNIPHSGASLQNSILLQDLCCTVCKPQLFSKDNNAMVLLHFMLMMHMCPFVIQVKPEFFCGGLKPSNISSRFFSLCVLVVSRSEPADWKHYTYFEIVVVSCTAPANNTHLNLKHSCSNCIQHVHEQNLFTCNLLLGLEKQCHNTNCATGWMDQSLNSGQGVRFSHLQLRPNELWAPFNLYANVCSDSCLGVQLLTCHLHPVLRLRMSGAITLRWDIPVVWRKYKYNVNNNQNTTKFIATAGIQYSNYNSYMFRPF